MHLRYPLALVLTTLIVGCAGAPKVAVPMNPAHSKAMNVLIAAGYVTDPKRSPVRDVPRSDIAQGVKQPGTGALDAGYALSNVLAPPPGIGLGFALGMSVMSLLLPSPTEPLATSMVLAWMPKTLAATPAEAQAAMQRLIDEALDGALAEVLKPPYRPVPRSAKQPGQVVITGGECLSQGARCSYVPRVHAKPTEGVAPEMLGGAPAWTWPHVDRPSEVIVAQLWWSGEDGSQFLPRYRPWLPDLAIYQAMSERLPEWVFLYLAPGTVSGGDGKFVRVPLVLNRGEPLYFITPAG